MGHREVNATAFFELVGAARAGDEASMAALLDLVRAQRRQEAPPEDDTVAAQCASADDTFQVRQVLAALEWEERMVMVLAHIDELSYEEVARVMGVSEPAVKSRIHRAKKSFLAKYVV